jgi:hypothetical protein
VDSLGLTWRRGRTDFNTKVKIANWEHWPKDVRQFFDEQKKFVLATPHRITRFDLLTFVW